MLLLECFNFRFCFYFLFAFLLFVGLFKLFLQFSLRFLTKLLNILLEIGLSFLPLLLNLYLFLNHLFSIFMVENGNSFLSFKMTWSLKLSLQMQYFEYNLRRCLLGFILYLLRLLFPKLLLLMRRKRWQLYIFFRFFLSLSFCFRFFYLYFFNPLLLFLNFNYFAFLLNSDIFLFLAHRFHSWINLSGKLSSWVGISLFMRIIYRIYCDCS